MILATGAAELHPVCPGNRLRGLFTASAARGLHEAGIDLPDAVAIGAPPDGVPCRTVSGRLLRFEGESGWVTAVVVEEEGAEEEGADDEGVERTHACRTVILGLGSAPRDVLARMAPGVPGDRRRARSRRASSACPAQ